LRFLIAATLALSLAAEASAAPRPPLRPPQPIDAVTLDKLLSALAKEPLGDGKLGQLRAVTAGRRWLFDGRQAIAVLGRFGFWNERAEALRLVPLADAAAATEVLRWFDPAPEPVRAEVRQILAPP
jgi:hypothetical protein